MTTTQIPDGWELVRTTPEFDETTVPKGLLRAHEVADEAWGRLRVRSGSLGFTFEDDQIRQTVSAGDEMHIPPQRPHHVSVDGAVTFVIEFYRAT